MPAIILDTSAIGHRMADCRSLLAPLTEDANKGGPAIQRRTRERRIAYAAHGGSPPGDIRLWRFPTFHHDFFASYIEVWHPVDQPEGDYFLNSIALTLFRVYRPGREEREFIALHCEPNEEPGPAAAQNIYKRSPHIHVEAAENPIPKSHLTLAHPFLAEVLASEVALFRTIGLAIEMLRDEVLLRA